MAKKAEVKEEEKQKWYLVDAEAKVLGRLAVTVAGVLYGKCKPIFRKDLDTGDGVIIINAAKIKVTGKKPEQKTYERFSGYPDGLKVEKLGTLLKRKPEYVIMHAVKGMLPKNKVGRQALSKLIVYAGSEHPHRAQKPEILKV